MEKIPSSYFSKLFLKTKLCNTSFVYAVNKKEVRHLLSKKFQNSNFKKIFIKIAIGKAKNDLVKQIVWLHNIRKKRKEIFLEKENIFPPVLGVYSDEKFTIMLTPFFFKGNNFALWLNKIKEKREIKKLITAYLNVFCFLNYIFYNPFKIKKNLVQIPSDFRYPYEIYISRLRKKSKNFKILFNKKLKELVENKEFLINEEKYLNPLLILNKIEKNKKLLKILTPPFLVYYPYADFHPANVLVNKKNLDFILVDPRGFLKPLSPEYDYSKSLARTLLAIDFIFEKNIYLSIEEKKKKEQIYYYFQYSLPPYSYRLLLTSLIRALIKDYINYYSLPPHETTIRLLFTTSFTLISFSLFLFESFYYQKEYLTQEEESLIKNIYLLGTILLNNCYQKFIKKEIFTLNLIYDLYYKINGKK